MTPRIGAPVLCVLSLVVALSCTEAAQRLATCYTSSKSQTADDVNSVIQDLLLRGAMGDSFCRHGNCDRSSSQKDQVPSIPGASQIAAVPDPSCETIASTRQGDVKLCGPCDCIPYLTIGDMLNGILAQCIATIDGQTFVGGLDYTAAFLFFIPDVSP